MFSDDDDEKIITHYPINSPLKHRLSPLYNLLKNLCRRNELEHVTLRTQLSSHQTTMTQPVWYYDDDMHSVLLLSNSTTPFTPEQTKALFVSRVIIGSLSFSFTLFYVMFIIIRSLYTFPWKPVITYSCHNKSSSMSLSSIFNKIRSECYIFSRPIARLFFILQSCECIAITYVFFELAGITDNKGICFYQAFVIQFFGIAKYSWSLMISVWMFWILVLKRRTKLFLYVKHVSQ
jgi:hypothetical protein